MQITSSLLTSRHFTYHNNVRVLLQPEGIVPYRTEAQMHRLFALVAASLMGVVASAHAQSAQETLLLWAYASIGVYFEVPGQIHLQTLTSTELATYTVPPGKALEIPYRQVGPSTPAPTQVVLVNLDNVTLGLDPKDVFSCQVKGGVGVGIPLVLNLSIEPAHAAAYLLEAGVYATPDSPVLHARKLSDYMATTGRVLLTRHICSVTANTQLRKLLADYNSFYDSLAAYIQMAFAEKGITVQLAGAGGKFIVGPEVDAIFREHLEVAICGELGCKPPTTLPMMVYEMVMNNVGAFALAAASVTAGTLARPLWGLLYPSTTTAP